MCVAVPGKVTEIVDAGKRIGRVAILGVPRLVSLGVLDEVALGDWVLVQVGLAVEKMDEAEAQETLRLLEEIQEALSQELAATPGEEQEP